MILAIETSTNVCSVALGKAGRPVAEKRIEGKGVHSTHTFLFIEELLDRYQLSVSGLEALLYSNGPGSYTGLRIGASAIKGLLFGQSTPLYTISTLLGFSAPFAHKSPAVVHSVIDARRVHLYYQKIEYSTGNMQITEPAVRKIEEVKKMIEPHHIVVGTGWERIGGDSEIQKHWYGSQAISAGNLIAGWDHSLVRPHFTRADVKQFEPEYLTMSQVNNSTV